jgi:site-specific DNA-methyltransferase (adenine-specific)
MVDMSKLMHGNCLIKMAKIPDGSVDLILCDLPYGTTRCSWDSIIPFEPLWEHYWRVLKPGGAVVLFGAEPFSSHLRMSQIKYYKYDWLWLKTRVCGFLNAKHAPLKITENIMVFSQGTAPYNPQGLIDVQRNVANGERKADTTISNTLGKKGDYTQKYSNYPEYDIVHSTQKPVLLLEYLIKTYSLEGETVLDNCMGSGSTGVAAINTRRQFIGIEMDDNYFEVAKTRIKNALTNRPEKIGWVL